MNSNFNNKKQEGFTLVEVLTVMVVLVAIASITLEATSQFAFENRSKVTKDRYEKISAAIIGNPNVLMNGEPNIKGFVSDMGRLPDKIRELIDDGTCTTDTSITRPSLCVGANTWDWNVTPTPSTWNGPYLNISKEAANLNALSDGWGNSVAGDDENYGWTVTLGANQLDIQSPGEANVPAYGDPYPADAVTSIVEDDWLIDISDGIPVIVKTNIIFENCDISIIPDQPACEAAGKFWELPSGPCKLASGGPTCDATWPEWDLSLSQCVSTNRFYCNQYIVPVTDGTKTISLKIEFPSGNNGITTIMSTLPATIVENGLPQRIVFNSFEDSVPASVTEIPLGHHLVTITYDGVDYELGNFSFIPRKENPTIIWQAP